MNSGQAQSSESWQDADIGPFAVGVDVSEVSNYGERYMPLIDPYSAAMHLGHMAAYKHALRYAYGRCVLDIGCGTGYGAHYLASFGASQVAAIDLDEVALDYARKAYAHPRLHYQCGGGDCLPFADGIFEFVFCSQVIEHIAAPGRFLAEIKRVLKPGGFCMVTTPNKDLFNSDYGDENEFHINEMSLGEFKALGETVFPCVEMAGIPQNCVVKEESGAIRFKPDKLLRLEDYIARSDDLIHCENMLLLGHTQPNGEFSTTLPDSLSRASTDLSPCFWDAPIGQWVVMGLYPGADLPGGQANATRGQKVIRQVFRSSYDNLFRVDVALEPFSADVEAILRDHSPGRQVLIRQVVRSSVKRLSLIFDPIENSSGREFCLELRPRRRWVDILLLREGEPLQLEQRGDWLALWTFHQTLPAL